MFSSAVLQLSHGQGRREQGCECVSSFPSGEFNITCESLCANTSLVFQMRLLVLSESSESSDSTVGYSDYIAPESYGNTQATQMNTEFHVYLIFLYAAACMILRVRFTTNKFLHRFNP